MANRYQHAKIYMLDTDTNDLRYYGATCSSLSKRLYKHNRDFEGSLGMFCYYDPSHTVLKHGARITLVEDYPCQTKDQLNARLYHHVAANNCVNKTHRMLTACECGGTFFPKEVFKHTKSHMHLAFLEPQAPAPAPAP